MGSLRLLWMAWPSHVVGLVDGPSDGAPPRTFVCCVDSSGLRRWEATVAPALERYGSVARPLGDASSQKSHRLADAIPHQESFMTLSCRLGSVKRLFCIGLW